VRKVGEVEPPGIEAGACDARLFTTLPSSTAGVTHTPAKGACLLELASTLPRGRWTDHPAGVDRLLAALAAQSMTTPATTVAAP
jgi:hypothetical protein